MARRMYLLNKITKQLSILAYEVELMNRSNRMTLNSDAETIFCGLINRLEGWELRNLNEVSQNYPGIDLADTGRRIAVQVTASANQGKVSHTLEVFFKNKMERNFDRLVMVIITDRTAPTGGKTARGDFKFDPKKDVWNIEWFKRRVESIEDCEHLQTLADYLDSQLGELPGDVKLPEHLLPAIPALGDSFLPGSRDTELDTMEKDLNAGKPVFIWGLGGMGKTQTAIALAARCAGPKGAYFLRYTLPVESGREAMMETILRADFTGRGCDMKYPQQEFDQRIELLRREYDGTVLVIDNLDWPGKNLDQLKAEKSFQDVLALSNAGIHLIFTTRYPVNNPAWEVGPMDEDRLVALMQSICTGCEEEALRKLIRAVDGHTLMVDLMARTLEESWNTVTADQLLSALQRNTLSQANLPEIATVRDGVYQEARLYMHIQALFSLTGLTDAARNVLRCAALLPGEGMSDQLLSSCFSAGEQQELKNLVKRGWLRREDRKIAMHPVVSQVCAGELAMEGKSAFLETLWAHFEKNECSEEVLRQIATTFMAAAPRLRDTDAALTCLRRAIAVWKKLVPSSDRELALYDNWYDPFSRLPDPAVAQNFKMAALRTKIQLLPANDPGVAAALGNMGLALRTAGDYQGALEYGRKSLEMWEEIFAAPAPQVAQACSNLGRTCYEMGDYAESLAYLDRALLTWKSLVKDGHPNITAVEKNIDFVKKEMA